MSENQNFGFGKFVPGFDFLQNLTKGASQAMPQMPNLAHWIAPTLNVEELERRIGELKAVHFWLDQNSKALNATIQALEVQKMTLATLKGMNLRMSEVAEALKFKPAQPGQGAPAAARKAPESAKSRAAAEPAATASKPKAAAKSAAKASADGSASVVDPLQWWGALTQQFQQIAATAMKDAQSAADSAKDLAAAPAQPATASASGAKPASKAKGGGARKSTAKRAVNKP